MPVDFGAKIIARALHDLGVTVIFGLPDEGIKLGIRFIAFRNEQASVYAASAYGYLTGKPGVCISVGGPGFLHVMAGIPFAAANSWPLLILSGASETHNNGKGGFQEMDALPMLGGMGAKFTGRPPTAERIPAFIQDAYRAAMFGRPGPSYVDLPANLIMSHFDVPRNQLKTMIEAPKTMAPPNKIKAIVDTFKSAKAPLIVVGKGAAYAKAEKQVRQLVERTGIPFFATPMGKGVVPDSSPYNVGAARSTSMKEADVVLVIGAKLNWILSFGLPPKWRHDVKIIQIDITADELGKNNGDVDLSVVGDAALVTQQLVEAFGNWKWDGKNSPFTKKLQTKKAQNEERARKKTQHRDPMLYEEVYDIVKKTLDGLSNPDDGDIVYVSEGANAMDIARTVFTMEHPRVRLDAGTSAAMGVGPAFAIASYAAYNYPNPQGSAGSKGRKKIFAIEGDSAFGFSAIEVETMARYNMDVIILVMNNGGLYRGDSPTKEDWLARQKVSTTGDMTTQKSLTAMTLGFETEYNKIAEFAGSWGVTVRTPEELKSAVEKAYKAKVPVVINCLIDPQSDLKMDFSWLDMGQRSELLGPKTEQVVSIRRYLERLLR